MDGDTYGYAGSYNYRWVTFRLDLSGTIAAGSRFLIGSGLTPNPDLSFRLGDLSSTGTQTFALVRTSNIAYTTDGVHLTQASVDAITGNTLTDAVTNWDGDVGDDGYFNAPVITEYPAYYSAWSTASRMPDGGDWSNTYGQYNQTTPTPVELGDATYDFLSTPGKANGKTGTAYPRQLWGACCTGTGGTTCSYVQSGTCSGTYKGNWRDCSHPRNPCDPNSWVSNNIQYAKTQGSGWGGRDRSRHGDLHSRPGGQLEQPDDCGSGHLRHRRRGPRHHDLRHQCDDRLDAHRRLQGQCDHRRRHDHR